MSDSEDGSETVDELRVEVQRLKEELALASREKIQAAEYGLVVLEEKQALKAQYEDLELLYETTKQELQLAQEVTMLKFVIFRWNKNNICPVLIPNVVYTLVSLVIACSCTEI